MEFLVLGVAPVVAISVTRAGVYVLLFATVVALGAKIANEVSKALEARPMPESVPGGNGAAGSAASSNGTRAEEQATDAALVEVANRDAVTPTASEPGAAEEHRATDLGLQIVAGDASRDETEAPASVAAKRTPMATEEPPRPGWAD